MKNFWCEVYSEKILDNLNIIKKLSGEKKLIAVVKGNAYGLGIEGISEILDPYVDYFAVSDMEEAQKVNTEKEILLLSPLVTINDFNSNMNNIIYTVDNEKIIEKLPVDKDYKVHIYVDTGMSRMGIAADRLDDVIYKLSKDFTNIRIDGIYTHLHNTKNRKYTIKQINTFKNIVLKYKDIIPNIHCLNSSGVLNDEYVRLCDFTNMVRAGNVIYGYDGASKGLKKVFSFKAKVVNVCEVKSGQYIGYGCTYKAKKDMHLGILGFGNIEHFGFVKEVKHGIIYDLAKVVYNHIKFRPILFAEGRGVRILGRPNMNVTLIDMDGINSDSIITVDITPILADSAVKKIYF